MICNRSRAGWAITLIIWLSLVTNSLAQNSVVISELLGDNKTGITDEDGDYSDWIELFNAGGTTVNLAGWSLTTDATQPKAWIFPSVNLQANEFLLVFASGKDRTDLNQPLHTNFKLKSSGEYLGLFAPEPGRAVSEFAPGFPNQFPDISYGLAQTVTQRSLLTGAYTLSYWVPTSAALDSQWQNSGFNDAAWPTATNGLGYQLSVPGFAVKNVQANISVGSLDAAEQVLSNAAFQAEVYKVNASVINYFNTGSGANFSGDATFPGFVINVDRDNFALEAIGTVTIPAAGQWTFGVNSDDGFSLQVGGFAMSYPAPRGPSDTLQTFSFPAAGDYPIRLVFYEQGGGSGVELFAAAGAFVGFDANAFRLVGDTAGGGLLVRSLPNGDGPSLGYGNLIKSDLRNTIAGKAGSVYVRVPFAVTNASSYQTLTLGAYYDDGFVVWLNGTELARRNAPAALNWASAATARHDQTAAVTLEQIGLGNLSSVLKEGANLLTVQWLNQSPSDVGMLLSLELTEQTISSTTNRYLAQPTPDTANTGGAYRFVKDTKFSVDRGFFTNAFDLELSTATTNAAIRYTTNGLPPSATNGFLYAGPIHVSGTSTIRAAAFLEGYDPSNIDTVTYIFPTDVIRQAKDGKAPTGWPTSWGGNTVNYGMDQRVVTNTRYAGTIIQDLQTIPSFSLVMNLNDLFEASGGIYANPGQDGRDWERPCSLELIHPDGSKGFQINAGIRIRGGFSRTTDNPKHAFRFLFRSEYGDGQLNYPLFGPNAATSLDGFDLRTFQNYSWSFGGDARGIFVRDVFSRDLQLATGSPGSHGNYFHLYINGMYWGLYNSDERPEASYGASYFGGVPEDYDVIKVEAGLYTINATDGNMEAWTRLYNTVKPGITNTADYFKLQGRNADGTVNPQYENLLDVDNLIDYMLVIYFGGNLDAPISAFLGNAAPNNWYGVRSRNNTAGFRFFVHDAEHTLLDASENRLGPFATSGSLAVSNPQYVLQKLWKSTEFKIRMADHIQKNFFDGGPMSTVGARVIFQKRKLEIDRAVVGESARWGDSKRPSQPFTRDAEWLTEINRVYNSYLANRPNTVLNQLRSAGLWPATPAANFGTSPGNVASGQVVTLSTTIGTIYYTTDGSDPRLIGGGISSNAIMYSTPLTVNRSQSLRTRVLSGSNWGPIRDGRFTVIQNFTQLRLTELMYNPPNQGTVNGDQLEFLELKNTSGEPLDLSGVQFTNGVTYTFPDGKTLPPNAFVVLVSNPVEFAKRYPGVQIDGAYTGKLSNSGERLTLVHAAGGVILDFDYADNAPWPSAPDGLGFSLVLRNPASPVQTYGADEWRASTLPLGSPGVDDPNPTIPEVEVTEVLAHPAVLGGEYIELHNPGANSASIGGWYLTDNRQKPFKYRLPNVSIPAGGYRVVTEAEYNPQPPTTNNFSLSSLGEEVYLFSANAEGGLTGFSHGFRFDAAPASTSSGLFRISTGHAEYPLLVEPTVGMANAGPAIGSIIISEVLYHSTMTNAGFIEISNRGTNTVLLYDELRPTNTWRMVGVGFSFPTNVALTPGATLVITEGDPARFRASNNLPADVVVLGPWSGLLQPDGETLSLQYPGVPITDTNGVLSVPYYETDRVGYKTRQPWPVSGNAAGVSIQRTTPVEYGNEPLGWISGSPNPGIWVATERPLDTDGDGLPDRWEVLYGLNPYDAADALLDFDGDGISNRDEYQARTNPLDPADVMRIEVIRAGQSFKLQFTLPLGAKYAMQTRSDLSEGEWLTAQTWGPDEPGRVTYSPPALLVDGTLFYRLIALP